MLRQPREDRAALVGRLYDAHGAALYRYALLLLADHAAAEDAVHQVFTAFFRQGGHIANDLHYLRRSIRNECYSTLRQRRGTRPDDRPLLEPVAPEGLGPEDRIALERGIRALPPGQREVLHLHIFEGMTLQEVAAATEESPNTVASRYRYAIAKLRKSMIEQE
ncbi:MAG TPA: sigma-70 family RNA polymerase sigma factor [Vicinamibacterales bacterium]|nr:sigma-70 family RNA polymerase sigma factor [Vicinamibacterales bacterium]